MDKKIRLPKEAFIDGQDVEGHGGPESTEPRGDGLYPREAVPPTDQLLDDVEGHRVPSDRNAEDLTILPSPPSFGLNRTPGGELSDDTDGEGIARR